MPRTYYIADETGGGIFQGEMHHFEDAYGGIGQDEETLIHLCETNTLMGKTDSRFHVLITDMDLSNDQFDRLAEIMVQYNESHGIQKPWFINQGE